MTERDPQLEQSLARLVARTRDVEPSWRDVERRAASARRRLSVVWTAAGLLFVTGAATGFGFGGGLWSLVSGKAVSPGRLSLEERRMLASMSSGKPVLRTEPDSPLLRDLGKHVSIRLLATRGGRSFYVIRVQGPQPRYCTSISRRREVFGALECSPMPFPSPERPVADFSIFGASLSDPTPRVEQLKGFAADGVAKVGFLDEKGRLVAPVPVVDNTYLRATGLPGGDVTAIVAYTDSGKRVFCEDAGHGPGAADPCGERNQSSPPPGPPPLPPPPPTPLGRHIQHGESQGVAVDVYEPGVAVFDLTRMDARPRRLTAGDRWPSCLRARFYHGRWLEDGGGTVGHGNEAHLRVDLMTRPFGDAAPTLPPPYDGCEMGGGYGHRWNDAFGTRAAIEIPLTDNGRHFFNDRAAARDLAYFVRAGRVQRIRMSADPRPGLEAFARRYPGRVVEIASPTAAVHKDQVGFWVGPDRIVFTVTSSTGRRFYVVATRGTLKLPEDNLGDLALVF